MAPMIMLVLALIVIFGAIFLAVHNVNKKSKQAKQIRQSHEKTYNATSSGTVQHLSGLPFGQDVSVNVYCCPDKIIFTHGAQEVTLERTKILSADVVLKRGRKMRGVPDAASTHNDMTISYLSNGKSKNIRLRDGFVYKLKDDILSNPIGQHSSTNL